MGWVVLGVWDGAHRHALVALAAVVVPVVVPVTVLVAALVVVARILAGRRRRRRPARRRRLHRLRAPRRLSTLPVAQLSRLALLALQSAAWTRVWC